ncbi:hypothetical protein JCM11641_005218 [Rhodosporidiobolus odoratus]
MPSSRGNRRSRHSSTVPPSNSASEEDEVDYLDADSPRPGSASSHKSSRGVDVDLEAGGGSGDGKRRVWDMKSLSRSGSRGGGGGGDYGQGGGYDSDMGSAAQDYAAPGSSGGSVDPYVRASERKSGNRNQGDYAPVSQQGDDQGRGYGGDDYGSDDYHDKDGGGQGQDQYSDDGQYSSGDDQYRDKDPSGSGSKSSSGRGGGRKKSSKKKRKGGAAGGGGGGDDDDGAGQGMFAGWSKKKKLIMGLGVGAVVLLLIIIIVIFMMSRNSSSSDSSSSSSSEDNADSSNSSTDSASTTGAASAGGMSGAMGMSAGGLGGASMAGGMGGMSGVGGASEPSGLAGMMGASAVDTALGGSPTGVVNGGAAGLSQGAAAASPVSTAVQGPATGLGSISSPSSSNSNTGGLGSTITTSSDDQVGTDESVTMEDSVTKFTTTATWFTADRHSSACQTTFSDDDRVAAIPPGIYGSDGSDVSVFCGAKLHVWQPDSDQTITVTVGDICTLCTSLSLDLSQSAFLLLAPSPSSKSLKQFGNDEDAAKLDSGVLSIQWWLADKDLQSELGLGFGSWEQEKQGTSGGTASGSGGSSIVASGAGVGTGNVAGSVSGDVAAGQGDAVVQSLPLGLGAGTPDQDSYSYSAVDKSPLSNYVMRHWWTWSASLMPPWLAPNCITLIGFGVVVLNFLSVWIWAPGLVDGPRWVYALAAAGLFFYQTMDNIDGKQARRTGTGSPMGEMFDHGCDTLNCPLSGIIQAAAFGLGHSPYALLCVLIPCWSMYVSTWEEYHTGTLYLGYINGPVEGILLGVAILVVSAVKGPGWWANPVSSTGLASVPPFAFFPGKWQVLDTVMFMLVAAFLLLHLPLCLYNVYKHLATPRRRPLTSRTASTRVNTAQPLDAFQQLLPILGFSLLSAAWVLSPKSSMLREGRLIEFAVLVCFLYGQLSSKIIIAQLTRGVFPYSPTLLLPLVIPAILINLPYLPFISVVLPSHLELLYLHLSVLVSFASYAFSTRAVLRAFCAHLGIRALRIPFPNAACEGYGPPPPNSRAHQSPAVGTATGEEYELERPLLASSSPRKPRSSLLRVKEWIQLEGPGSGLLGGEGGRKRSNTSEREREVGMDVHVGGVGPSRGPTTAGEAGLEEGARKVAKVGP